MAVDTQQQTIFSVKMAYISVIRTIVRWLEFQTLNKSIDFSFVSTQNIMNIQKKLNNRPREKLNFDTPKFCFFKNFD